MDNEMKEIMKSFSKGRQVAKQRASKNKSAGTDVSSYAHKSLASNPIPQVTTQPQTPVKLTKNNNVWEWEYNGCRMRHYYSSGLWFSENGLYVFWGWWDRASESLTQLKPIEINTDFEGRKYVKNSQKEQSEVFYVDEAVGKCFKGGSQKSSSSTIQAASSFKLNKSTFVPTPKKPTVTKVPIDGYDYGFFYDPIKAGKNPMWVSETGGLAAFIKFNWETKTPGNHFPYNIHLDQAGRKSVRIKEKDGTWTEYDLATAICKVFNGNPPSQEFVVKFRDGDVGNCDADNLCWDMP